MDAVQVAVSPDFAAIARWMAYVEVVDGVPGEGEDYGAGRKGLRFRHK